MTKVSLHRFAKLPQRFLLALGLGLGILTVGAIAPPPSLTEETPTPKTIAIEPNFAPLTATSTGPTALLNTAQRIHMDISRTASPDGDGAKLLTVTLYTPTASCDAYKGDRKAVAADQAIAQIVHALLTEQTSNLLDFELAGYRILPGDQGNTLTIDFRRQPGATRHFISLSICEQQVLFGSVRETLLQNPELGISAVIFTEQGQPIQL
ncbi:hypothetical protein [Leptolyngbya iicbica]|uniref:GerMN domain-containing protein n=2 Tax=Cyanophyceae TaxID=3028117 RepID=A0A4Q7E3E2_9CYAN|nr:hypothetical protein [Leptolyngbya sp. LK]RZM76522.1 hypothetical protein DYY88_17790 [Leptolyngbya sp. LK]